MKKTIIIILSINGLLALLNSDLDSPDTLQGLIWPIIAFVSMFSSFVIFAIMLLDMRGNPFRRPEHQYDPQGHLRATDATNNINIDTPNNFGDTNQ